MRGLSLVATSGGHSSSRCAGLSLSRPLPLRSTGSRRAGSVVVAHGPSCSAACGIFPDQGSNPCPLHWQADSQPLRHQGGPRMRVFSLLQSVMWSLTSTPGFKLGSCYFFSCVFLCLFDYKEDKSSSSFSPHSFSSPFKSNKTLPGVGFTLSHIDIRRKWLLAPAIWNMDLDTVEPCWMRQSSRTLTGLTAWVWRTQPSQSH